MRLKIKQVRRTTEEVEVDVEVEFPFYYGYGNWCDEPNSSDTRVCLTESGGQTTVTRNTSGRGDHKSWEIEVEKVDVVEIISMVLGDTDDVSSGGYSRPSTLEFNEYYDAAMAAIREADQ